MKIYSSLSRSKEEFKTLSPGTVKMYVCGVTPYDSPHLGHALSAARFQMIRNYLEYRGFKVTYVQNVTDVDDKIINRSSELGVTPAELSQRYTKEYNDGLIRLGFREPDHEPRVSQYIPEIIRYIEDLIKKGAAYATPDGDVYFDVQSKKDYGKLSGRDVSELIAGTREEVRTNKRHSLDFALWKADSAPGASWPSPWGVGRPGWHIECSVMCDAILGEQIDIHGGGLDLIFPHHENEIAQCEAHSGKEFARFWCHNGLLMVEGKKMSKSLGNFMTIDDAIDRYGAALLLYVIMKFHYRSPVDFTDALFADSLNQLVDYYRLFDALPAAQVNDETPESVRVLEREFVEAMDNDFNTSVALTVLDTHLRQALGAISTDKSTASALRGTIERLGRVMCLFPPGYALKDILTDGLRFQAHVTNKAPLSLEEVDAVLRERDAVRAKGDFKRSDVLRDELAARGVRVLDKKGQPSSWQFVTGAK